MRAAILVALLAVVAMAYAMPTEQETQVIFTRWMQEHNKVYSTEEFQTRYSIWKANYDFVLNFPSEERGFTVAMNQFADLTTEEWTQVYKGLLAVEIDLPEFPLTPIRSVALPTEVDWRTKGVVTAIKNQGQCGSCWSFSTTGSLEGAHALNTGSLVSLSEQNLVDCSGNYGNQGCDGGLMDSAFQYIIANHGIDTEASYPYHATDGQCRYSQANCGSTLASYKDVAHGSESALETAVAEQGPISVAIDASHNSFQLYSSGVYYEPSCSSSQLDHGVLAVGYGASGSSDYWIVKNSWGTSWGMNGYIWMARNRNNNCGIASMASYPLRQGANKC